MASSISGNDYAMHLAQTARTPEQFKVPPKIYFHHFNYAKFHFDCGGSSAKSISFANYRYITDDKREQDQLDLVADVPGTYIYTIPDSEISAALKQELNQELAKDVYKTAIAQAQVNNVQFDPNAPIVPVQVQHVTPTPVNIAPAVVGMANSLSGVQATNPLNPAQTQAKDQTSAPTAADEAAARIAAMTAQVQMSTSNPEGGA